MVRGDASSGDGLSGFPDFEPKGHLVQQILDTKRELEDANKKEVSSCFVFVTEIDFVTLVHCFQFSSHPTPTVLLVNRIWTNFSNQRELKWRNLRA